MELTDFDLILLDVMMGGMSGFQIASEAEGGSQDGEKIPIIFLTRKIQEVTLSKASQSRLAMTISASYRSPSGKYCSGYR